MNLGLESNLAMNAERNYNIAGQGKSTAAKQLSSGYRINSAADDAAGLTISEKMRHQIRGLNTAADNIDNGTSYVQVADGALSEVQSMLHRLNELSVQAANDTNTAKDRLAIDKEVQELKTAINKVFEDTEFNTKKIWTTDTNTKKLIGVEPVPAVVVNSVKQTYKITDTNKWAVPYSSYKISADKDDGLSVSWTAYNGNTYSTSNIPWPEPTIGSTISFALKDYLDTTTYPELTGINYNFNFEISKFSTMDDVIASLNNASLLNYTGEPVSTTIKTFGDPSQKSSISAPGVTISFSSTVSYPAQLASDRKFDSSTDTKFIEPAGGNLNNFHMNAAGGWFAEFDLGTDIVNPLASSFTGTDTSQSTSYRAITSSEPNIPKDYWWYTDKNGTTYFKTHTLSPADGTVDSLKPIVTKPAPQPILPDTKYGCMIDVSFPLNGNFTLPVGNYTSIGSTVMHIQASPTTTVDQITDLINTIEGIDTKANGFGIEYIYKPTLAHSIDVDSPIYEALIDLKIQSGDVENNDIDIQYKSLRLINLGIGNTNTKTQADSENAITEIANALDIVNEQRSLFGSYQNRLSSAHSVAELSGENTQASESRIRDTDMANVMVAYSAYSILQQTGESILAQSNSNLQQVLSLLQF